jgi:hypothetical protein
MANKRSQLFVQLVCEGLGYCCTYAFLRVNKQTGAIATRLGVSDRTVRLWKAKYRAKEVKCEHYENCMLAQLRRLGK